MRTAVFVFALSLSFQQSIAQRAQIGFVSDSVIRTEIVRVENSSLVTENGTYVLNSLKYIEFADKDRKNLNLYKSLKKLKVKIYFSPVFLAKVEMLDGKRYGGYIYNIEEGKITLLRKRKKTTIDLTEVRLVNLYENKSGFFWGGFGIGVAIQLTMGGVLLALADSFTADYILIGLFTGNLVFGLAVGSLAGAIMVLSNRPAKSVINVAGTDQLMVEKQLVKYQTIRNEIQ